MFTVYRYMRGCLRARVQVAEFQRADVATTYAQTLAMSTGRTEQARWESAVATGGLYVPGAVLAYGVDGLPPQLGYFPIPTPHYQPA